MESDLIVNNVEELNNLKNKYGKRAQQRLKVKFYCSICNMESVRLLQSLTSAFLCKRCVNREVQNTPEIRAKIEQTNYKKYGTKSPTQNIEIQNKVKQTNIKKYGVAYPSMNSDIQQSLKKHLFELYGVTNVAQLQSTKNKVKETNNLKYGVDNVFQLSWIIDQNKEKSLNYINTNLNKLQVRLLQKNEDKVYLQCEKCNNEFVYSTTQFYRLLKLDYCFCPNCSIIKYNGISVYEKEVLDYIKTVYSGYIISNDRSLLFGKEIDIYLPDLKLGFEFDGTYWHADPRFYEPTFLVHEKLAKDIWKKDKEKDLLAESLGIKLIRIKEYDWIYNRESILLQIKECLE